MGLPPVLDMLKRHPGIMISNVNFDAVVAFIDGFNLAISGGLLVGFHEWLVVKLGYGNNFHWSGLVLRLAFAQAETPEEQLHDAGNQKRALDSLFGHLESFLRERESAEGLRRIFLKYEGWLKCQDWYDPSSPQWIAEKE